MPTRRNKVALITGSGKRRIGWHIADALAARGYDIAVHYHTSAAQAAEAVAHFQNLGARAADFGANLTDEGQVRGLVAGVIERFGRIDVLATCAAIWKPKPLADVTSADVREMFEVNTLGTFVCCQQAGLAMARQAEGGSIITFGDWAIERPYVNYSAYFPSKGAIPTLTRMFAVELARRNPKVRVNCVSPGPVMFPPELPEAEKQAAIAATLARREGSPDNVAAAVLYLVENDFVTGTNLIVDGGRTVYGS